MNAASPSDVSNTAVSWFPVVTLIIGFAISSVSDWLKYRRDSERERAARIETRRDQRSEQRRNFQRQTLLELQEAVQDLARASGATHHHDEMAFRQTGRWQRDPLSEELNDQFFQANRRVLLLVVRVRDESLRSTVQRFKTLTNQTATFERGNSTDSDLRDASNAALQGAVTLIEQIHERIGEILRTLDDEEAET
jgi:hypothetical protein